MLEKTLENTLDSKEIKPILKEISPEYPLEELMLKPHYFGHLMWRADSLEKTLILGKIEGKRRAEQQSMMVRCYNWLNGHEFEWTQGDSDGQRSLVCCSSWGLKELYIISGWTTMVISSVEAVFTCFLATCLSSLEKYLLRSSAHFFDWVVSLCVWFSTN